MNTENNYPIDDFPNPPLENPFRSKIGSKVEAYAAIPTDIELSHPDIANSVKAIKMEAFTEGAQYGYNLAQVFVNDLKENCNILMTRIKELEDSYNDRVKEIVELKNPK